MKVLDSFSYKQKEDLGMVGENCTIPAGLLKVQKDTVAVMTESISTNGK